MRIALIAGTYFPERCGVADYTAQLRQALEAQGVETLVLTTHQAARHQAARHQANPTIRGAVMDWTLTELPALARAIRATDTDLLHIQHAAGTYAFQRAIFLLPLLLRLTGYRAPIVVTAHEYGWWEWQPAGVPARWLEWLKTWGQKQGYWDREDGFLLTQSRAVIVTNVGAETAMRERLPDLPLHRIPIAANVSVSSLDRCTARQQLRQRCGWEADRQVIAFFGFLHPVKGIETLLLALRQMLDAGSEAGLILIGGCESLVLPDQQAADYWQQLQQRIGDLDLEPAVHRTGYLPAEQVSELLLGADLGVLPFHPGVTLKSGSLLTLLAHNLPVVATRADPPDPDLEGFQQLQLVSPRHFQILAEQLQAMLQRSVPSDAWKGLHPCSWSDIATQHHQIYQNVLSSISDKS